MTDYDITLKLSKPDENAEDSIEKMRALVADAEAANGCRFSILWFREPTSEIHITTSGADVSDHERTILAAFARPAMDQRAAHSMGKLEGIVEAMRALYGEDRKAWPAKWRKRVDSLATDVGHASSASAAMVRLAMAAFDLGVFRDADSYGVCASDAGEVKP